MERHQSNAIAVALYLRNSKKVVDVIYPGAYRHWYPCRPDAFKGLPTHPGYEVMLKQTRGFSGMITFRIKGGLREAKTFLESVKVGLIDVLTTD